MIFISFSGGVIIAGGVFAFITIIGVIPRLIAKTATQKFIVLYENCIVMGGIVGLSTFWDIKLGFFGKELDALFGLFAGIFVGCLAVSLAEILDVIPILTRRARIKAGLQYFLLAVSVGKMFGSLIYFIIPGFMEIK